LSPGGFAWTTLATYLVGGPFVHVMHGAVGKGFGDFGLRLATPIVVGLLGGLVGTAAYQSPSCNPGGSCDDGLGRLGGSLEGFAIGGVLGIVGAVAMDAALLAYEPLGQHRGDLEPPPRQPHQQAIHIEPSVGVTPERLGGTRATFGLMGTF
jgi:hypothetical protein